SFCCSSRVRHTRSKRDWSSDVCSSDLEDDIVMGEAEFADVTTFVPHPLHERDRIAPEFFEMAGASVVTRNLWRFGQIGEGGIDQIGRAACRGGGTTWMTRG